MKITHLFTYPVKGFAAVALSQSTLQTTGLPFDREWMVVDAKGQFVTQRQLPAMAAVKTQLTDSHLILKHASAGHVEIPLDVDGASIGVKVWESAVSGVLAPDLAQQFIHSALGLFRGHPLRLVRYDRSMIREIKRKYLKSNEQAHTFFADGFPYLIVSEQSLAMLNTRLVAKGEPAVPMSRFRANIVVDACVNPFDELFTQELTEQSGHYQLAIRKPCERCPVTTVDQVSGIRVGKTEPLATLRELNPLSDKKGAFMGGNAVLVRGEGASIQVGDTLQLL